MLAEAGHVPPAVAFAALSGKLEMMAAACGNSNSGGEAGEDELEAPPSPSTSDSEFTMDVSPERLVSFACCLISPICFANAHHRFSTAVCVCLQLTAPEVETTPS